MINVAGKKGTLTAFLVDHTVVRLLRGQAAE